MAAQNPSDHLGTFPLPESQLDRFSVRVKIDYPHPDHELEIFTQAAIDPLKDVLEGVILREQLVELQSMVDQIHVSPEVAQCVKAVVDASRSHSSIQLGISTRGGVQWVRLARAVAILQGRSFVTPDDLIQLADYCLPHRMIYRSEQGDNIVAELLQSMDI